MRKSSGASPAPSSAHQEATLSAEMSAKEELKAVMEAHKRETLQEKDQLLLQVQCTCGVGSAGNGHSIWQLTGAKTSHMYFKTVLCVLWRLVLSVDMLGK